LTGGLGATRINGRRGALVFNAPCKLRLLSGLEHGRTIPLADIDREKFIVSVRRSIAYSASWLEAVDPALFAVLSCMAMEVRPEGAETILIVDDDETVRNSAAFLIASLGYRVLSAGSGPEALEVLRGDTPIDLLFTDVFMPGGLHGPQLVAAARRLRPELKILFTSGYFEYAEIRHALDPDIEQVSKPYEPDVLAAILRRTLSS
jgi:CheY-like chemotaxis protein